MFTKTILSATALLAGVATAGSAPGFPIDVTQNLTVTYSNNTVSPGGERIPRPETAAPPTVSSPVWFSDERGPGQCVLLMVDLDVPRNNSRVQLVHWIATNVTRSVPISANTTGSALDIPSDNPVPYLQPSPPVGDSPHSYTFILMQQPRNFSIPSMYADLADNRVGFNVSQFAADANLTTALAATWITVQNLTDVPSNTSFPPPRPSPTGDGEGSSDPASGDASGAMIGGRTLWTAISTAVVAVGFAIAL